MVFLDESSAPKAEKQQRPSPEKDGETGGKNTKRDSILGGRARSRKRTHRSDEQARGEKSRKAAGRAETHPSESPRRLRSDRPIARGTGRPAPSTYTARKPSTPQKFGPHPIVNRAPRPLNKRSRSRKQPPGTHFLVPPGTKTSASARIRLTQRSPRHKSRGLCASERLASARPTPLAFTPKDVSRFGRGSARRLTANSSSGNPSSISPASG